MLLNRMLGEFSYFWTSNCRWLSWSFSSKFRSIPFALPSSCPLTAWKNIFAQIMWPLLETFDNCLLIGLQATELCFLTAEYLKKKPYCLPFLLNVCFSFNVLYENLLDINYCIDKALNNYISILTLLKNYSFFYFSISEWHCYFILWYILDTLAQ